MAKMSKTQRDAILTSHANREPIQCRSQQTFLSMIKHGNASRAGESALSPLYPTHAGLINAGIDIVGEIEQAHDEAQTLNYWIKHPHTYAEHLKFGTLPVQREALVVSGEVGRAHGDALIENTLRRPHMVQAMAIGAAERARAAGTACYHPRSCSECDSRGNACGAHRKGDAGHESCSGTAPEPGNAPPHCPAGEACTGRAFPGHPAHKPRPLIGTRGRALPADDPHSAAFPGRPTPIRDRDDERYPDVSRDDAHGWALMESLDLDGTFRRFPAIEAAVAHVLLGGAGAIGWNQRRFAECDNAGCDSVHYCPAYGPR